MNYKNDCKIGGVFLVLIGLVAAPTTAQAEDPINKAIREEAPAVLKYVRDHGYNTVGVLVFTVKKGNQPATLKTGTLNTMIARRLETALVLLNTKESGILAPNESYTIDGFYMSADGKDVRPFKVLSDDESAKVDISPEQKGVFSFFVFRPGSSSGMNVTSDGGDLAESSNSKTDSTDLSEVQRSLRVATHTHTKNGKLLNETSRKQESHPRHVSKKGNRGLVVEGDATAGGKLNRIDASLDAQPAISQFIRYYTGPTTPAQ